MSEIDRYDEFLGCFFGKSCFFIGFFEKYSIFFWKTGFLGLCSQFFQLSKRIGQLVSCKF